MRTTWMRSFNGPEHWSPVEVTLGEVTRIGERGDFLWATTATPIPLVIDRDAPVVDCSRVLVGARHQGGDVRLPLTDPLHVYVCVPRVPAAAGSSVFSVEDVRVAAWAILYPTESAAWEGHIA